MELKRLSWYVVFSIPCARAAKYGIKCIKVYRKKKYIILGI